MNINELLKQARSEGATTLHIVPGAVPKDRVSGNLRNMSEEMIKPADVEEALKTLFPDKEELECGTIGYSVPGEGRYTVKIQTQRSNKFLDIGILYENIDSPESLHIPESILKVAARTKGLVLVSGPRISGRSTTIVEIIKEISTTRSCNIYTIEDPIRYTIRHGNGIVIQKEKGIDYDDPFTALQDAAASDADVILIEKLNTPELIELALELAEEGRLIFSQVTGTDAQSVLNRLLEYIPDGSKNRVARQMGRTINTIISQRLIHEADGTCIPAFELMHCNRNVRAKLKEGQFANLENHCIENSKSSYRLDDYIYDMVKKKLITTESAVNNARNFNKMKERCQAVTQPISL